jgi:hypothetical protein
METPFVLRLRSATQTQGSGDDFRRSPVTEKGFARWRAKPFSYSVYLKI